jgi:hypothetical protein
MYVIEDRKGGERRGVLDHEPVAARQAGELAERAVVAVAAKSRGEETVPKDDRRWDMAQRRSGRAAPRKRLHNHPWLQGQEPKGRADRFALKENAWGFELPRFLCQAKARFAIARCRGAVDQLREIARKAKRRRGEWKSEESSREVATASFFSWPITFVSPSKGCLGFGDGAERVFVLSRLRMPKVL